jgi:hypothetical protein
LVNFGPNFVCVPAMEKQTSPRSFDQMSLLEMKAFYDQELIMNSQVDAELQAAHSARLNETRIVILGSRFSGKTTVAKSVSAKLGGLYASTSDREASRRRIRAQIYENIASLLDYGKENGTALPETNLRSDSLRSCASSGNFSLPVSDIISFLSNKTTHDALNNFRASNNGVSDNLEYLAKNSEAIFASNYVPSADNCIMLQEQDSAVHDFAARVGNLSSFVYFAFFSLRIRLLTVIFGH